jgi:type I restriction-modification system DNA methylase subunit
MPNSHPFVTAVNVLLEKLDSGSSINTAIDLANEILSLLGAVDKKSAEELFESSIELPNAERYDSWFQPHPIFKSDRACFDLSDGNLFQAKFYWLKKHSRQIIAGGVHFTPNFEDEDFTHNDRYKVGVDFFLSPNGKSLQVVLSNRGNLRIVELNKRLNSTQLDIFTKWDGAGNLSTQEALHSTLWESFKLKSVNQKFYDGVSNSFTEILQHLKTIGKDEEEAKLFASRLLGRLLFCWFLRKKGIIDESVGYFNAHGSDATSYYKQSLERLFFLTLNTPIDERDELTKQHQKALFPELLVDDQPSLFKTDQKTPYLNGGLFEPHENDWYKDDSLTLPEGFFANLYGHFEEFNFTTDESSPEYEQIAIDPEMLGRVFESLLATQLDETGQQARKAKGAFYTPREIVSYMCKESLRNYLYNAVGEGDDTKASIDSLLDISDSEWAKAKSNTLRDKIKDYRMNIIDALDAVTILDPACGSGAFPMGMLQLIVKMYERLDGRFDPYKTKLQIIRKNIFGIDIEPMAVEIARLRAWLSLIVDEEDARSVEPLPNLDFKFVCANSLIPLDGSNQVDWLNSANSDLHEKLANLRNEYFNARKPHTKKAAQDKFYKLTKAPSGLFDDTRTKQLKSFDPFKNNHPSNFFDTENMFGLDGFDIVIGNPPYIRHRDLPKLFKDELKDIYSTGNTTSDIYCYFYELAYLVLKEHGIGTYITSNKWLKAKYGQNLRKLFKSSTKIITIIDLGSNQFSAATVDTNIMVFQKDAPLENSCLSYSTELPHYGIKPLNMGQASLSVDGYSMTDQASRNLLLKVEGLGKPLKLFPDIKINYGVLTGKNEIKTGTGKEGVFILTAKEREKIIADDYHSSEMIKPILRGRDIKRYGFEWAEKYLITAHYGFNKTIEQYPGIKRHLEKYEDALKSRAQVKRGDHHWMELDQNPSLNFMKEFSEKKIIYSEISSMPSFAFDSESYFHNNKAFHIIGEDLFYILGFLNSKLSYWILKHYGPTLGNSGFEYRKIFVEKLPLIKPDIHNKSIIEEIVNLTKEVIALTRLNKKDEASILEVNIDQKFYELYQLDPDEVSIIENFSE